MKKTYQTPSIKLISTMTEDLLAGTQEGVITDIPATEPAMSQSIDMDLAEEEVEKKPNVWEE